MAAGSAVGAGHCSNTARIESEPTISIMCALTGSS